MSAAEREQQLNEFIQASPQRIFNAQAVSPKESIFPASTVSFSRHLSKGVVDIAAGRRPLRKALGKTQGYIIIAIIVPEGMTF